jgi:tyrosyl-tRNA synthetase
MVELVHGKAALEVAEHATQVLFGGDPTHAPLAVWEELARAVPLWEVEPSRLEGSGLPIAEALAESGLCPSKGQARKDIQGGGISLNQAKVADPALSITRAHLLQGRYFLLRKGKKNYGVGRVRS